MDRFQEETPANFSRNSRVDRDEDSRPDVTEVQAVHPEKCFYCDREDGVPFLMIGDELHCSRCFEEFTREEFHQYLIDAGVPIDPTAERKVA